MILVHTGTYPGYKCHIFVWTGGCCIGTLKHRRLGFEYMRSYTIANGAIYKSDCDSWVAKRENHTLNISQGGVACARGCMWGGLLIEYHTTQMTVALGWVLAGWQLIWRIEDDSSSTIDSYTHMHMHASTRRSNMCEIEKACMFAITITHLSKRGVVTCNIIHCVFIFLQFFWLRPV